ncbi:MAG: TIGR02757 family protein [Phycisphaerae bacterium]
MDEFQQHKRLLEQTYDRLNRRELVHPDPLEFLYFFEDPLDREAAGLVAACLAYGRVAHILRSVWRVLARLGPRPARTLQETCPYRICRHVEHFRHRFQTGRDVASLLMGIRNVQMDCGSLQACFTEALQPDDANVLPALRHLVAELDRAAGTRIEHLLPDPSKTSACKRLHLFLRWMVRRDDVDPGGWSEVPKRKLIVPLDTHMHKMGQSMGLTARKSADLRTAIEVTRGFAAWCPEDPVRYDFALTRLGIRREMQPEEFLRRWNEAKL